MKFYLQIEENNVVLVDEEFTDMEELKMAVYAFEYEYDARQGADNE